MSGSLIMLCGRMAMDAILSSPFLDAILIGEMIIGGNESGIVKE